MTHNHVELTNKKGILDESNKDKTLEWIKAQPFFWGEVDGKYRAESDEEGEGNDADTTDDGSEAEDDDDKPEPPKKIGLSYYHGAIPE